MNSNKVFRYVWRINALVILLAGATGLAATVFILVMVYRESYNRPRYGIPVKVSDTLKGERDLRLGYFGRVEGTPYMRAELASYQGGPGLSGSGGWRDVRNLLFYNMQTHEVHWLLPDQRRVIADTREIREVKGPPASGSVIAFVFLVADSDTNGDGRVSEGDQSDFAISDPTGTKYHVLAQRVDNLSDVELKDPDVAVIFCTSGGAIRVFEVDIHDQKIVTDRTLSPATPAGATERDSRR